MMDNSTVVSEWKENFILSQPTSSLRFGGILCLVAQATNCLLLTIPS